MVDHFPPYLYTKRGTFYFSRRIPKDLLGHFSTPRIMCSLKTKKLELAVTLARTFNEDLEAEWWQIRRRHAQSSLTRFLVEPSQTSQASDFPTLSECRDIYLQQKGVGKGKAFFHTTERAISTVIRLSGDKPADHYSKQDALTLRGYLKSKGLTVATSRRMFSVIRSVMNFASSETGLEFNNPFSRVFLGEPSHTEGRKPVPSPARIAVQKACRDLDDERRWLVALLSDSGMRLSEAIGLGIEDIRLDADIPHLVIQPHPWRTLKTRASQRIVPLSGEALWAAGRLDKTGRFAFPSYCDGETSKSNSASQALNKWMGTITEEHYVLHGFRHAFRDRLRAIECPPEIIDQLGGWALPSVGQSYGQGYPLETLNRWMTLMTKHKEPRDSSGLHQDIMG